MCINCIEYAYLPVVQRIDADIDGVVQWLLKHDTWRTYSTQTGISLRMAGDITVLLCLEMAVSFKCSLY